MQPSADNGPRPVDRPRWPAVRRRRADIARASERQDAVADVSTPEGGQYALPISIMFRSRMVSAASRSATR